MEEKEWKYKITKHDHGRFNSFTAECGLCGRVIRGITAKHVDAAMQKHLWKHEVEDNGKKRKVRAS